MSILSCVLLHLILPGSTTSGRPTLSRPPKNIRLCGDRTSSVYDSSEHHLVFQACNTRSCPAGGCIAAYVELSKAIQLRNRLFFDDATENSRKLELAAMLSDPSSVLQRLCDIGLSRLLHLDKERVHKVRFRIDSQADFTEQLLDQHHALMSAATTTANAIASSLLSSSSVVRSALASAGVKALVRVQLSSTLPVPKCLQDVERRVFGLSMTPARQLLFLWAAAELRALSCDYGATSILRQVVADSTSHTSSSGWKLGAPVVRPVQFLPPSYRVTGATQLWLLAKRADVITSPSDPSRAQEAFASFDSWDWSCRRRLKQCRVLLTICFTTPLLVNGGHARIPCQRLSERTS